MASRRTEQTSPPPFKNVSQTDLPSGRKGKHHQIVADILRDLADLDSGRALKIPLSELPDTKANVRSALNRATKVRKLDVLTSSDDDFLYIWIPKSK